MSDHLFKMNSNSKLSEFDTTLFKIDKHKKTLTYKDVTVLITSITSKEIKDYCIKEILEYFLTDRNGHFLKLSDYDTTLFIIDKQKKTLTYKDVTVLITSITSKEIKDYCIKQLFCEDIYKYIIDSILDRNSNITLNIELYNIVKSSQNKLYILKYIFSKYYNSKSGLENKEEIFKIFIEHPSYLIDLLRQMISTNNKNGIEYILRNKIVSIDRNEYKKLQDYASNLHLFEFTNILTIYESIDAMLDNKILVTDKSMIDELWS
jgi:hypothetical protein